MSKPTQHCLQLCSLIGNMTLPDDLSEFVPDMNRKCPKCGDIPIHKAIRNHSLEWVNKLLETGKVELERKSDLGGKHTPLMRCCTERFPEAAEPLLTAGCKIEIDFKDKCFNSYRVKSKMKKYIKAREKRG